MAISHVCYHCGRDLARHRTAFEPHYHWPVVACPECGRRHLRRRHPMLARWRALCRGWHACLHLVGRLIAIMLLGLAVHWGMRSVIPEMRALISWFSVSDSARLVHVDFVLDRLLPNVAWSLAAIISGAFIAAALRHWKPLIVWPAWLAILLLLASTEALTDQWRSFAEWITDAPRYSFHRIDGATWWKYAQGAFAIFVVSLFGSPLGWLAAKGSARGRRKKWRRRLAKARRRKRMS